MQTVVETPAYLRAAKAAGLSEKDMAEIVDLVAANPSIGDAIKGSGGCRKVRFAGRGKGKSGGYRIISFFSGPDIPIFLLTVFGKGERSNITDAETAALATVSKALVLAHAKPTQTTPTWRLK